MTTNNDDDYDEDNDYEKNEFFSIKYNIYIYIYIYIHIAFRKCLDKLLANSLQAFDLVRRYLTYECTRCGVSNMFMFVCM